MSESVTRSPIELFWTDENREIFFTSDIYLNMVRDMNDFGLSVSLFIIERFITTA